MNALIPAGRKRESWPGTPAEQQALRQRITAAADPPGVKSALLLGLALNATG